MNIQKLKKQLGFIDSNFFPEQECVIQDFDPNIFKSKNEYLIMIYDSLRETLEFIIAKPYIYKTENEKHYGWDCNGNYIRNSVKPVYSEFVVAFKKKEHKFEKLNDLVCTLIAQNNAEYLNELKNYIKNIFHDVFTVSSVENFPANECVEKNLMS